MHLVLVGPRQLVVVKLWLFVRIRRVCMWATPLTSVFMAARRSEETCLYL